MSEIWAERQRRTNQLVRIAAEYIFNQEIVTSEQLYGLCQLTWITKSKKNNNAYIKSTKIPALEHVFQMDFPRMPIEEIAEEVSKILKKPAVKELIISHTGFTNFFKVYRNSSLEWIKKNHKILRPLFEKALQLSNEKQRVELIKKIAKLPSIPTPEDSKEYKEMHAEYLITPVFFALDSRIKFPIINGNQSVKNLLAELKVTDDSLEAKYKAMISLYGTGGINDAADLDQIGKYIIDFVEEGKRKPTKKLLENQPTTGVTELPFKDESDVKSVQQALTIEKRRLHNELTNKLKLYLKNYTLFEGRDDSAMFDVLVENYDENKNDLLIEVKSSSETAHVRMAIGQLYDYWFKLKGKTEPHHLAILLPNPPDKEIKNLLEWRGIGILWFSGNTLKTCCEWLDEFVESE
ncbi:hypothetical protein CRENPOLYSF2_3120004 [Crenothrix polyspora]|uniref:Uncharacterized protein n=1 Tax=Crenothrix polyspora TaxID=360316 RepID=A0A1R4HAG7_9GAMM|nr:hypothetical protein [Crenothrix polyspora]SJM93177.1 hypothetical protein CRENPOLYSF2_3120004 [Crenothrix polyspora]